MFAKVRHLSATRSSGSRCVAGRASRLFRFGVWAVFALMLVGSVQLAAEVMAGPTSAQLAAAGFPEPTDAELTALATASPQTAADTAATVPADGTVLAQQSFETMAREAVITANRNDILNLLPAWRWRAGTGTLFASYGFLGSIAESPMNAFAGFFFAIASWVWWILLGALNMGLTLSLLDAGSFDEAVNNLFAIFGGSLFSSGLVALLLIFTLIMVVGLGLKGRIPKVFSTIFSVLVPIAVLYVLTSAAADGRPNAPGSPVWLARTGVRVVDAVGGSLGQTIGGLPMSNDGLNQNEAYAKLTPSCAAYKDELYDMFSQASSLRGSQSISIVSKLWEQALLQNWMIAQYGNAKGAQRIYCHQLEGNVSTSRAEQVSIGKAAGYPSIDYREFGSVDSLATAGNLGDDLNEPEERSYFQFGSMELDEAGNPKQITPDPAVDGDNWFRDRESGRRDPYLDSTVNGEADQAKIFLWIACYHTGGGPEGWKYQAAWYTKADLRVTTNGAQNCLEWWYMGVGADAASGDENTKMVWADVPRGGGEAISDNASYAPGGLIGEAKQDSYDDLSQLVGAFRGNNTAGRLLNALITLVTSVIYLYVLGGIAVGTLVAKIGFVVMLVLLPATLFLLAMPRKGEGRNQSGVKMMKMTIGYLAASFTLIVVLTLLLGVMSLITGLANNLPLGGGNGLLNMLVPLVALFLLRKAFKAAGLGDIASAKGALGMANQVATGAAAGKNAIGAMKAKQDAKAAKKDARNKALENGTAGRFARASAKAKKWGSDRVSGAKQNLKNKGAALGSAMLMSATGHDAKAWKDRFTGPGGLTKRLGNAAGLANEAAKFADGRNPVAANAIRALGRAITGFNPGRLEAADAAMLAAERKKEERDATKYMGPEARAAALAELADRRAGQLAENTQAMRNENGVPITVEREDGTIGAGYGVVKINADGSREFVADPAEISAALESTVDPATGEVTYTVSAGYAVLSEPTTVHSDLVATEVRNATAQRYNIDVSGVSASSSGLPPVFNCSMPTKDRRNPCPDSSTVESHLSMLDSGDASLPPEAMHFARGLSEDGRNRFIHQMRMASGLTDPGTGARASYLEMHGIDSSSSWAREQAELQRQNLPSAFDDLPRLEVPSSTMAMIMADVSSHERKMEASTQTRSGMATYINEQAQSVLAAAPPQQPQVRKTFASVASLPATINRITYVEDEINRAHTDERARHQQIWTLEQDLAQHSPKSAEYKALVPRLEEARRNHQVVIEHQARLGAEREQLSVKVNTYMAEPDLPAYVAQTVESLGVADTLKNVAGQVLAGNIEGVDVDAIAAQTMAQARELAKKMAAAQAAQDAATMAEIAKQMQDLSRPATAIPNGKRRKRAGDYINVD